MAQPISKMNLFATIFEEWKIEILAKYFNITTYINAESDFTTFYDESLYLTMIIQNILSTHPVCIPT